ncbi:hypothetical protein, partial [Sphingopyxis bauzanensis]|uniref:hypothetical protein n=1 Tax=Sphingopyxis bauzanensis TaxID=651663 RepID=UPI001E499561
RNAAHDQIGIVRSFKSECCARSRRNAAHDQIGTLRAMTSESAIAACAAGNRSYRQPLPVQLQYHHGFSKSDHRRRLLSGDLLAPIFAFPKEPGLTPALWGTRTNNQGIFKAHFCGELHAH